MVKGFDIGLPNFASMSTDLPSLINKILWIFIIGFALLFLMKFMQHRRLVKMYEKVKGGYVVRYGRYNLAKDRSNQLQYLRPMFGSGRLPNFPFECWQKIAGIPIIGVRRVISIIKQNENSYKVLMPPSAGNNQGTVEYFNTLNWVFIDQFTLFKKKISKEKFLVFLAVAAPLCIILGAIIFWIVAMYQQGRLTMLAAGQIRESTQMLIEIWGKP